MKNNVILTIFNLPNEAIAEDLVKKILLKNDITELEDPKTITNNPDDYLSGIDIMFEIITNLFDKKIDNDKAIELIQEKFSFSKEVSQKITTEIVKRIIPYGEKITFPIIEKSADSDQSSQMPFSSSGFSNGADIFPNTKPEATELETQGKPAFAESFGEAKYKMPQDAPRVILPTETPQPQEIPTDHTLPKLTESPTPNVPKRGRPKKADDSLTPKSSGPSFAKASEGKADSYREPI
jgi:hypothetical protein